MTTVRGDNVTTAAASLLIGDWWTYLQRSAWFNTGANAWQWSMSVIGLAIYTFGLWVFWQHRCHVCHVRTGKHPVDGTTYRVCDRHHLVEHHDALRARHAIRHPDRLTHGRSYGPPSDIGAPDPIKPARPTYR